MDIKTKISILTERGYLSHLTTQSLINAEDFNSLYQIVLNTWAAFKEEETRLLKAELEYFDRSHIKTMINLTPKVIKYLFDKHGKDYSTVKEEMKEYSNIWNTQFLKDLANSEYLKNKNLNELSEHR